MKTKIKESQTEYDDKGFVCECGKRHDFVGYVYAHWDIELSHTCPCGRKHIIYSGIVWLMDGEK